MTPSSIALLSALLLALQVVWLQAVSYAQGHHLAYAVISVALLGFGAGGSFLAIWNCRPRRRPVEALFVPALWGCALASAWLPRLTLPALAGLEVDLFLAEPRQWLRLIGVGATMLPPFFFGSLALAVTYATRTHSIGKYYAANLVGSAAGAMVAWGLLHWLLPERLMGHLAWLAVAAAAGSRPSWRLWVAGCALVAAANWRGPALPRSPYKDLSQALLLPDHRYQGPWPHPQGRLEIIQSPALRYAPDVSLNYRGAIPAPPQLFINGNSAGPLFSPDAAGTNILLETPLGLAAVSRPLRQAVCLAPAGTALPLLFAAQGAGVLVVEPHPRLAAALATELDSSAITLLAAAPRTVLARPLNPPPDVIAFPPRGFFGGPTGLQALGEDLLLTEEAVRTAWNRLGPEGRLVFLVWLDAPPRHAPRLIHLIAHALRREGIASPAEHLFIVRGWGSLAILAARQPFSPQARIDLFSFAEQKGWDVLWPSLAPPRFHLDDDPTLANLVAAVVQTPPDPFWRRYPFDLRPPTDDRPFFNQFVRDGGTSPEMAFLSLSERAVVFLQILLGLLALATLILVLGPLLPLRAAARTGPFPILYFAGLGAGFMFWEVGLLPRLTLLWGEPVLSVALTITALLGGMSLGSLWSRRWQPSAAFLAGLGVILALWLGLWQVLLQAGIPVLLSAPAGVRYGLGLGALLLGAVPLGLPFPLGLRLLAAHDPRQVPWACGIDSSFAVLTPCAAALLAFCGGFSSLGWAAAAAYLLAACGATALGLLRRQPPPSG